MAMADTQVTPAPITPSISTSDAITIKNASMGLTRTMPPTADQASHARTLPILVIPSPVAPERYCELKRKRVVDRGGWPGEPPAKRGTPGQISIGDGGQNWISGWGARSPAAWLAVGMRAEIARQARLASALTGGGVRKQATSSAAEGPKVRRLSLEGNGFEPSVPRCARTADSAAVV